MAEVKLTQAQQAVVENRGGALLVSAAAGSGKTKVLVDRLLSYVEDPIDPANIDEFLIITYTKAAASELRGKISAEISKRLAVRPDNRHLQRQLTRIHLAQISTVHAFCAMLLRRYCALRDLPPDFRVAEQTEADAIRLEVFQNTLEDFYKDRANQADFSAMADQLGFGRDDRRLIDLCLSCYDEVRCRRDMDGWMKKAETAYERISPLEESPWGAFWMKELQDTLRFASESLQKAMMLLRRDETLEEKYGPVFKENLAQVQTLAQETTWDGAFAHKIPDFGRIPGVRDCADEAAKARAQKLRKDALEAIRDAQRAFYAEAETVEADLKKTTPAIRGLLQLLRAFDEAFTKEKRRRKLLDFSDLEHETIALLYTKDGKLSRTAREISEEYREILVDEYQDSNEVQECIFEAVSKNGQNRFLVGDVKQSIYRFRLADPGIFLQKYESYASYEEAKDAEPRKILLSDNFRSRREVLAAANDVFSLCMQGESLELRYGEAEKLRAGLSYPETETPKVELHCIELDKPDADEQSPEKREVEARFVASRIRKMLDDGMQVTDAGTLRPVRMGDIVILLRSLKENPASYQKALAEQGIASQCDRGESLFDTTEAQVLLATLKIIDNPHRDVDFVAALASPVFGVSAEELARARVGIRKGDYYESLLALDTRGEKLDAFLSWLADMRSRARLLPLPELFDLVLQTTGMEDIFSAMENGAVRRANLQLLRAQIASFSAGGNQSLMGFLRYMDDLAESGNAPAVGARGGVENAVQIMSMHQSKGLEFPVVFLADLSKRFNLSDASMGVLLDETLLAGANVVDMKSRSYFPSLARLAIGEKMRRQTIAEELRVLYVAMTRAKEVLVMSYCASRLSTILKKWNEALTLPLPPRTAASVLCLGDWVLLTALCRTEAGELFAETGPNEVSAVQSDPWVIRLHHSADLQERLENTVRQELGEPETQKPAPEADFTPYAHLAASKTPSKLTATALKGRLLDLEAAEQTPQETKNPERFRLPVFGRKSLSGRARGSATHLFMQFANYEACRTEGGVTGELERLAAQKFLTPEQAGSVQTERIVRLFASPFGARILEAKTLRREFKFSILTDAGEYVRGAEGEQVMLQGVVDCFWLEPDGIVLVDFKTDKTPYGPEERAAHYAPQLRAYAKALSRMYGLPVREKILYFFSCDCAYRLE